ncbi:MAG: feruloyl-CoA synthase [Pseudorhodoplanes sp.]|uniref:feruloyl-CoA synthase n=1 Tax=Pseudorhodoplanes sp. TaxID=1934341 RepID=UPI003D10CD1D
MNSTMSKPAGTSDKPPFRPLRYAEPRVVREDRSDGAIVLRCAHPLGTYEPNLARLFRGAVERQPDRLLMAERDASGAWAGVTYAQARKKADAVAQALMDRGLSAERPVMVLSGNAVEHGILTLACYTAGIPVAPISVAYSLQSQDHAKLKYINELLTPGLVYVSDTAPFARALAHVTAPIVAGNNGAGLANVTLFSDLEKTRPGPAVDQSVGSIAPDTIAKFLFTSGSTSLPKGVINTHRMLTANQQQSVQCWPFIEDEPMVLIDWLPWNHTFGSNYNFNLILQQAGTLYIDAGKPVPALVGQTVQNLREIAPSVYFNVPAGYGALLPFLEKDDALARHFFSRVRLLFYAGASLPQDMWDRLEALAIRITGQRVPMTSAWGTTETSPLATSAHTFLERAGNVGVPVPGCDVKLVPSGGKLEIRVRGPNITPGYWRRPDLTEAMFDEEGYYLPGDAVRFADPNDPDQGLIFDGRTAEDFKLTNGTWVAVGALRVGAIAAATPVLQDAIVCGEGRDQVGLVAWLNAAGCRQVTGEDGHLAFYATHPKVHIHLRGAFAQWNKVHTGATMRVARVLLLPDMPSIDRNEITDKGYINQRVALECRRTEGERLFDSNPHPDVVVIG